MFWYKLRSGFLIFSSQTRFHFHDLITFGRDAALHQAIIFGYCLGIEAFTPVFTIFNGLDEYLAL